MNDPAPSVPPPAGTPRRGGIGGLVVLLVLLALAWAGWHWWEARVAAGAGQVAEGERIAAMAARMDALRRDQRANAERVQQAEATIRLLREEVIGLGQRAALLEDSLAEVARGGAGGLQALRLAEVEVLLSAAADRLASGDLDGARRAYALAAGMLDRLDDPALIDLRQALAQERAALDGAGPDPRDAARARLDAFAAAVDALPVRGQPALPASAPWWRRLAARAVDVRPSGQGQVVVAPSEHAAGLAALHVELALARAALERRDEAAFGQAVVRLDGWVGRLWPPSPERQAQRAALEALADAPLRLSPPELGSTLEQLARTRRD